MTNNELNAFIMHYLEHDKTNRAIMLTGAWGSGKSHYIKNELVPYLVKNGESRCVVVSLYGLKDISEISKSIYLELRAKNLRCKTETAIAGKTIAKTIAKGFTSFFGIDLSLNEEQLQELYASIDLSDKLIVLEDLERTQIEISQLLGYVNHLVEQDSIKVLLVANESEIIKYEEKETDKKGKKEQVLTPESKLYIATKEKTVGDTIAFEGDYNEAVVAILNKFEGGQLAEFATEQHVKDICFLLSSNCNLRTFIYACQKAADILDIVGEQLDSESRKIVFYSIILFSKHIKTELFPKWEGSKHLSMGYTSLEYPLFRFCYDYIRRQVLDVDSVQDAIEEFRIFRLFQRDSDDKDMNTLHRFYTQTEENVLQALNNITEKLNDPLNNRISINDYGKLTYYYALGFALLGYDHSVALERMIQNIKAYGKEIDETLLFLSYETFIDVVHEIEFTAMKQSVIAAFEETRRPDVAFDYAPENVKEFSEEVVNSRYEFRDTQRFISTFDIERLAEMVFRCNAEQIYHLRRTFSIIYKDRYSGSFDKDIKSLLQFEKKIQSRCKEQGNTRDRIVQMQIRFLRKELQEYIHQLQES